MSVYIYIYIHMQLDHFCDKSLYIFQHHEAFGAGDFQNYISISTWSCFNDRKIERVWFGLTHMHLKHEFPVFVIDSDHLVGVMLNLNDLRPQGG